MSSKLILQPAYSRPHRDQGEFVQCFKSERSLESVAEG